MTDELIELGRTSGAYGFMGWVRIAPHTSGEVLTKTKKWVFISPAGETTPLEVEKVRRHGKGLVAKWKGCESKEAADLLRGSVGVYRSDFPKAGRSEVWAVDLVDLLVVNKDGVELGRIKGVSSNGVQDLFVVEYESDGARCEFMIPNVKDVYVLDIDVEGGRVSVDWDPDWR